MGLIALFALSALFSWTSPQKMVYHYTSAIMHSRRGAAFCYPNGIRMGNWRTLYGQNRRRGLRRSRAQWVKDEEEVARLLGWNRRTKKFLGNSTYDFDIPGYRELVADLKARQRWSHHRWFREIRDGYAGGDEDRAILVSKERSTGQILIIISAGLFKELLGQDVQLPMRETDGNP